MTPAAIPAVVLKVQHTMEVLVEFLVIFLAALGADFPAGQVQDIARADECRVKAYSEHFRCVEGSVILELY